MPAISKRATLASAPEPVRGAPAKMGKAGMRGDTAGGLARSGQSAGSYRRFAPIALLIAGLGLGYALGLHEYLSLAYLAESRDALKAYVADNRLLSAATFLLAYALAVAFSFPAASVLTIFGGFLFGWLLGSALVAVGATLGATALFLAARSAFGDVLRSKVGGFAARLADGFEEDAFTYLLVLRLAPFIPFFVVNIAPALFDVRLRTYVLATFIGILPGVVAYSYLGQGVDSVLIAAGEAGRDASLGDLVTPQITFAFVGLALVAALGAVVKRLRASRS
jgi:uncharacterized membrane protein YdjX (TVP38/TMEM64 family)